VSLERAPFAAEYLKRMRKEVQAVEQDLVTGRNIEDYTAYRAKVKERAALERAMGVFEQLLKDIRKGEDGEG
jgi:hypothetical protein